MFIIMTYEIQAIPKGSQTFSFTNCLFFASPENICLAVYWKVSKKVNNMQIEMSGLELFNLFKKKIFLLGCVFRFGSWPDVYIPCPLLAKEEEVTHFHGFKPSPLRSKYR